MAIRVWYALLVAMLCATPAAWADTLTTVTSAGAQASNDSVDWSQLGADQTAIPASFGATSLGSLSISGALGANGSMVAVKCAASPCSWTGAGFNAGDSLVWTSDAGNGGNGPLALSFGTTVAGAGALIQPDGPGQFSAQIQVFNGLTLLGTVSTTSDVAGDATYLGVTDTSGANISGIVISLTSVAQGLTTDFAVGKLLINSTGTMPTPTPTATPTPTPTPSPTPTPTPTPTSTPTPTPTPVPVALKVLPHSILFGKVHVNAASVPKKITLLNPAKLGGPTITLTGSSLSGSFASVPATSTCFTSITQLAPKQRCTIFMEFEPLVTGPQSGSITFQDNAHNQPQVVHFSGKGIP